MVLGASYRGGVKETAFSGVFPLVVALIRRGAEVWVHDPLFTASELQDLGLRPYVWGASVDVAILQADHVDYRSLRPTAMASVSLVFDGRRVIDPLAWPGVGGGRLLRLGAPPDPVVHVPGQ